MIILVPTQLEMRRLIPELGDAPRDHHARAWLSATSTRPAVDVACCGFGLAAAGAGAAAILAGRSDDACLVGVAGTLRQGDLAVGSAVVATSVQCHGLGLPRAAPGGSLDGELASDPALAPPDPPLLPAALRSALRPGDAAGAILSVAIPSASAAEAEGRAADHPGCLAEEMEALAVLHATTALGRSLTIIRGVSNLAGERDKSAWRIDAALAAARGILDRWLDAPARQDRRP